MGKSIKVWVVLMSLLLAACGGGGGSEDLLTDASVRCGSAGSQTAIANGTPCFPSSATPVVRLSALASNGTVFSCSGFKVASGRVLTSAHCVESDISRVAVVIWDDEGKGRLVRASSWTGHPDYVENQLPTTSDVAVVVFPEPLPAPPMAILGSRPAVAGQMAFIAGWGLPDLAFVVGSARISSVTNEFVNFDHQAEFSRSCLGDSGGPAYQMINGQPVALGVLSFGVGLCTPNGSSSFANLQNPSVLGFIQAHVPGVQVF